MQTSPPPASPEQKTIETVTQPAADAGKAHDFDSLTRLLLDTIPGSYPPRTYHTHLLDHADKILSFVRVQYAQEFPGEETPYFHPRSFLDRTIENYLEQSPKTEEYPATKGGWVSHRHAQSITEDLMRFMEKDIPCQIDGNEAPYGVFTSSCPSR